MTSMSRLTLNLRHCGISIACPRSGRKTIAARRGMDIVYSRCGHLLHVIRNTKNNALQLL